MSAYRTAATIIPPPVSTTRTRGEETAFALGAAKWELARVTKQRDAALAKLAKLNAIADDLGDVFDADGAVEGDALADVIDRLRELT